MAYLEMLKRLDAEKGKGSREPFRSETRCEKGELCEKENTPKPVTAVVESLQNTLPLSAARSFLTIQDIPELEKVLQANGWKVARRGNELICWSKTQRKPST